MCYLPLLSGYSRLWAFALFAAVGRHGRLRLHTGTHIAIIDIVNLYVHWWCYALVLHLVHKVVIKGLQLLIHLQLPLHTMGYMTAIGRQLRYRLV